MRAAFCLVALSAVGAWTGTAFANTTFLVPGGACLESNDTGKTGLSAHVPGGSNNSSFTAGQTVDLFCPVTTSFDSSATTPFPSTVHVTARDGSGTEAFSCTPWFTSESGWIWAGPLKYTCSTAGGCADLTTVYMGETTLDWTFDPNTNWFLRGMAPSLFCTLPPGHSDTSVLRTYRVVTQ
jgi:hypothetical protein